MDVIGYPNYMIYDDGRVWSKPKKGGGNKFLKACSNGHGYPQIRLFNEDGPKIITIHRLVAMHYIPNPENKPEVDHKDRDRQNNNINNLRWTTSSENSSNRGAYGTIKFKGVSKKGNKFRARIFINGKTKNIGTYDSAEEANQAYINYVI